MEYAFIIHVKTDRDPKNLVEEIQRIYEERWEDDLALRVESGERLISLELERNAAQDELALQSCRLFVQLAEKQSEIERAYGLAAEWRKHATATEKLLAVALTEIAAEREFTSALRDQIKGVRAALDR